MPLTRKKKTPRPEIPAGALSFDGSRLTYPRAASKRRDTSCQLTVFHQASM